MFRKACEMGLEGIVSKRRDARYRSRRSKVCLKCKNPGQPGYKEAGGMRENLLLPASICD
jgi:ATP-dependent DNA ligase